MEKNELKDLCRKIVSEGKINADEKKVIREVCNEMGIELNTKCSNCYIDAASIIYNRINAQSDEAQSGYVLNDGVDVTFAGIRVCEATLTDELAKDILAAGFPKYLFKSIPEE